jgi:hypothetical protein
MDALFLSGKFICRSNGARVCKGGAWYSSDGGPCPVSSRRAKKDIVYLRDADCRRIADELAHFKLATYEYCDPALAGKRHLGFIVEDIPGSPAVERDGNRVDLYGHASMLVAAVRPRGKRSASSRRGLLGSSSSSGPSRAMKRTAACFSGTRLDHTYLAIWTFSSEGRSDRLG